MRNRISTVLGIGVAAVGLVFTSAFVIPEETATEPCGVFALGDQKVDLNSGERSKQISSKDLLIASVRSGIEYSGSGSCAGYEINTMDLTILTDKENVKYEYDLNMIRQMQSMDDFMLARYFNDARTLVFNNISVKNTSGEAMSLPDVSYQLD